MRLMDDARVGAAFRAVRIRRGWRQQDVADRAHVSRALVSLIERGHCDRIAIAALRRVAAALDIKITVTARWRAGDLDRLINAGHSAMHEAIAAFLSDAPGWLAAPEVSFAIYGERGVIDILAFHPSTGSLLIIEIKTDLVDIQEMVGTFDRKQRLAKRIAGERGWSATTVSSWLVVAEGSTNQRRAAAHRTMLRNAYPDDGHALRKWIGTPVGTIHAMSFWSDANPGSTRHRVATVHRVGTSKFSTAKRETARQPVD